MPIRRNDLRYTSLDELLAKGNGGRGFSEEQIIRIVQRHEDSMVYRKEYQERRQDDTRKLKQLTTKVAEAFDMSLAEFLKANASGRITDEMVTAKLLEMKGASND